MKFTLRIKKNSTFRYVLNKGKFKSGKYISIHVMNVRNKNNDRNYFGVCISKKNGNSVQRNKMKRWIREIYKKEEILLKKGKNIVVLYKKGTIFEKINYHVLNDDMIFCLKGLDMYE